MTPTATTNGKSKSVGDSDQGDDKESLPPPANLAKQGDDCSSRFHSENSDQQAITVRDWRNQLQKAFLSNKTPPKPEAMPELDQLFTIVENYNGMTIEQLDFSKIGKVMRHIGAVSDGRIPRDDEFRFRVRANNLVEKWRELLNVNKRVPTETLGVRSEEKGTEEITQVTMKNIDLNRKLEAYARA